jgi:Protein of unknown function (DUF3093)
MGAYRERLLVPVGYWLLAIPVVTVLGAEAYFFVDGWIPPLVIGLLAVLVGTFFVRWSMATIEVAGNVLRADGDTLALSEAGDVIALDEKQAARLRGPRADPSAHVLLRPYLSRAVCVTIADPGEGGVPYWLIATRHPERLAAAISAGRDSAGRDIASRDIASRDSADRDSAGSAGAGDSGAGGTGDSGAGGTGMDAAGTGSHQPGDRESVG